MKKFRLAILFLCLSLSGTAVADTLAIELHNTEKWNPPRIGVNLKLSERVNLIARKGIGGPDPTILLGYLLKSDQLAVNFRLGGNTDDELNFVFIRPEVVAEYAAPHWNITLGESFAKTISDTREDNLYSKLTLAYCWDKFMFGL